MFLTPVEAGTPPGSGHPLLDLPDSCPSEDFSISGIPCAVRFNPLPAEELAERSMLCSQRPFQYFFPAEGKDRASYAATVRTVRGRTATRLRAGLFDEDLAAVPGVAAEGGGEACSEAEWEYAARGGTEGWRFPWAIRSPRNSAPSCPPGSVSRRSGI